MKKIEEEFSKNAHSYREYSSIQKKVVQALLENITTKPKRILEMGSGTGEVFTQSNWQIEQFTATDISKKMCEVHPKGKHVTIKEISFDSEYFFTALNEHKYDFLISSSALHWSEDLDALFKQVSATKLPFAFSLFTSGTFLSFLSNLEVTSYLKSKEELIQLFEKHFVGSYNVEQYTLSFTSARALLQYIKKTGVSINKEKVSVGKLKNWIDSKPSLELEFEVLFFYSDNR